MYKPGYSFYRINKMKEAKKKINSESKKEIGKNLLGDQKYIAVGYLGAISEDPTDHLIAKKLGKELVEYSEKYEKKKSLINIEELSCQKGIFEESKKSIVTERIEEILRSASGGKENNELSLRPEALDTPPSSPTPGKNAGKSLAELFQWSLSSSSSENLDLDKNIISGVSGDYDDDFKRSEDSTFSANNDINISIAKTTVENTIENIVENTFENNTVKSDINPDDIGLSNDSSRDEENSGKKLELFMNLISGDEDETSDQHEARLPDERKRRLISPLKAASYPTPPSPRGSPFKKLPRRKINIAIDPNSFSEIYSGKLFLPPANELIGVV